MMILEEIQLNIIITVATFLSAITLGLTNTIDNECLTIGCDLLNISLSITNFGWLSCLMLSSHIILNKDTNPINHKICLLLFSFAFIFTLSYSLISGIYRILFTTNFYLGIVSLINLSMIFTLMIIVRYNYIKNIQK